MTIWRMCIARCVTKAIDTHSEYVLIFTFALQQWLQEGATLYLHVCLVGISIVEQAVAVF
jgi:hypothetical protein